MPSKSKTPRQVLASRHGGHRSPKLVIHQTHSFWHRRWRKYNAVPPLASSRHWNVGAGNGSDFGPSKLGTNAVQSRLCSGTGGLIPTSTRACRFGTLVLSLTRPPGFESGVVLEVGDARVRQERFLTDCKPRSLLPSLKTVANK